MKSQNEATKENIHQGHRERLRKKALCGGMDSLSDHELIELCLFYAIPRQNTNEQAHRLLRHFGSLERMVNADVSELCQIDGIHQNSALLFHLMAEMFHRIALQGCKLPPKYDEEQTARYLQHLYVGEQMETVYVLFYDNGMRCIDTVRLSRGTVNQTYIEPSEVVTLALLRQATGVLLAHNHPGGIAIPSREDIETTTHLSILLREMNIQLIDHLLFAGDRYISVANYFPDAQPISVENSFYEAYLKRCEEQKSAKRH